MAFRNFNSLVSKMAKILSRHDKQDIKQEFYIFFEHFILSGKGSNETVCSSDFECAIPYGAPRRMTLSAEHFSQFGVIFGTLKLSRDKFMQKKIHLWHVMTRCMCREHS
jgi:hypothetical protein